MDQIKTAVFGTKRIRLTRSMLLADGKEEGKEGEVRDLPIALADDLILMGSAVLASEAQVTKRQEPERPKQEMRKIKLLESIILAGGADGQKGEVREVPIHVAYSLIDDGVAQPCGWVAQPLEMRGPIL